MILVYWLILVNLAAFILYGYDKSCAKKNKRRIPEKTLLFWAWIGGSVGAFLGMRFFHHKTLKAKFFVVPVLMVVEIIICVICLYQNYHLVTTDYEVDLGIPSEVTIVQVSDLHNQFFGINQSTLLKRIKEADPDIIVITGDVVDKTHTNFAISEDFIEGAVKIAPVYYITGNHEVWIGDKKMSSFYEKMRSLGVIFLDDTYVDMGDYILAGIGDSSLTSFVAYPPFDDSKPVVMLAHEPQFSELYKKLGADLVLTGHYHGGQIIIPGVGGFVSPEYEIFPKMYEGCNDIDGMQLVISRGLGNSVLPVRINNYPELVVVKVR
jgi:hypothetical protein